MNRNRALALIAVLALLLVAGVLRFRSGGSIAKQASQTAQEQANLRLVAAEADPSAPKSLIEGIVVDDKEAPVEGAAVVINRSLKRDPSPPVGPPKPAPMTVSGRDGRFRFEDVRPGEYTVTAMAEGRGAGHQQPVLVGPAASVDVRVVLEAAFAVSGRVLDIGGGPVPDATVVATLWSLEQPVAPVLFQTTSKSDGSFRFYARKGTYGLNARATGYVPGGASVTVGGEVSQDIVLQPAARLSGRVIERGSERGVGEAKVSLIPTSMGGRMMGQREVVADSEGKFSYDDVAAGVYQLAAAHESLEGVSTAVAVGVAETVADIVVPMSPAYVVSGRAVDAQGKPVADALVFLGRRDPPWNAGRRSKTDADGNFEFKGVFAGKWNASLQSDDFPPKNEDVDVRERDVKGVLLKLAVAAKIEGQVVDSSGRPVANALVSADVMPQKPGASFSRAPSRRTDADGRFVLKPLGGGKLFLTAQHDSAGTVKLPSQPLAEGEQKQVTLKLDPSATIEGVVRYDDGSPAAGVTVSAQNIGQVLFVGPPPSATTGPDGSYVVKGLTAGDYHLRATRPGRPAWSGRDRLDPTRAQVAAGERKRGVDLQLKRGGKSISGVVVSAGKPIANATVSVERDTEGRIRAYRNRDQNPALTDPDGRFTVNELEEGTYVVVAEHSAHAEGEVTGVAAGATSVTVELPASASIAGVLVTKAGQPVANATVTVVPPATNELEKRMRVQAGAYANDANVYRIADPSGAFQLGRLAPATYEVKATTPDGRAANQTVSVAAGEKKSGVRLVVESGIKLVGRVVSLASGEPIEANVQLTSAGRAIQAKSGPDGKFEVEGAVPGDAASLRAYAGMDFIGETMDIDVPKGKETLDLGTIPLAKGSWEERSKSGDNRGVGVGLTWKDGRIVVASVFPGSAAEKAGLKQGEILTAVDGKPTGQARSGAVNWLLMGKAGTDVSLTLEGGRNVKLTREEWKMPADKKPTVPAAKQ